MRYYLGVIKDFLDREAEKLFQRERSRRLPVEIQTNARRKLEILNAAASIQDLRNPPSNHLEKLKGDRRGRYSIRINDQWRICFYWDGTDAHEVEIVDYH